MGRPPAEPDPDTTFVLDGDDGDADTVTETITETVTETITESVTETVADRHLTDPATDPVAIRLADPATARITGPAVGHLDPDHDTLTDLVYPDSTTYALSAPRKP